MMWGRDAYWEYVSRPYAFNVRRPGEHRGEEESFSAWALANRQQPLDRKLALVGWVPTMTRMPVRPWAKPLIAVGTHLGGTHFYAQALPEGLTARYIEFDVLNFGCGSAVFDFETGVFDWSCG